MSFETMWAVTFVAMFVTDVCWAFYVSRVKDASPMKASLWAVALFVTGAIGTISYVKDPWLLIPAAIGGFAGTYAAVWLERRKELQPK